MVADTEEEQDTHTSQQLLGNNVIEILKIFATM